ncbi:MAG: rRNA maturation RNase YbeY [Deltaproteobacteria bacterium]|nr:rRNA maturation RNase YbeY [Candidatus Anaeroferrophillacea bacterium]
MPVDLLNRQTRIPLDLAQLKCLAAQAAAGAGIGARRVEAALVDDAFITPLNRDCFGHDRPTTVISLVHGVVAGGGAGIDLTDNLLGEVIVSVETVQRETAGRGYTTEEGVLYYLVHGFLHLAGHEHVGVDEESAARMFRLQDEIFDRLLDAPRDTRREEDNAPDG